MKQTDPKGMFQSIEDQVIETTKPVLRQKVLEQTRRTDVRLLVLACCLLGPRRARKAISSATDNAVKQVSLIVNSKLPSDTQMTDSLNNLPRDAVNEELLRRIMGSLVARLEGIAETTIRQELVRLVYWGSACIFVVTHAIHWILF